MDADALVTFLAVHREGGFSSAARVLHRTQPAISRRIALLEQSLGVPLFERTAGAVVLSQAGRVLLPHAERALAALQDAESAVRALTGSVAGPLPLAVVGTLAGTGLTAVLRDFARDHPDVALTLRTARSVEVSDLVRTGEATIGLRYDRDGSPDLEGVELGSEPLLAVCAVDQPLAGASAVALASLRDEPWLAFPERPGLQELAASHVLALFRTRGLGDVAWTPVDSLTAQKRLVEAGFGLALVPASSVAEERAAGSIAVIDVTDLGLGLPVFAVTRRGGFLSVAAARMLELLRDTYARTLAGPSAG